MLSEISLICFPRRLKVGLSSAFSSQQLEQIIPAAGFDKREEGGGGRERREGGRGGGRGGR